MIFTLPLHHLCNANYNKVSALIQPSEDPNFRDKISTVDTKGKRKWMYVLQPEGRLYRLRTIFSIAYLSLFFGLPFIKIYGNPLFQFNILEAKFTLFGKVFLPQDFILFGIGMLVFLLFIIVFTLIFGRVFCGWACPQTVFLEMVFRRIEYWIEGSANHQEAAEKNNYTTAMYFRKFLKHTIFLILSFLIANTFLSYIIGMDQLFKIIQEPISMHIGGFIAIAVFTLAFYAVYAFVREIVCTVICPYGRLQSVLLDKNSIVVAYDYLRGEPREKAAKMKAEGKGDCIDCGLCVKVCPTGIDIRNGTQLECVNCTACIDACNMMMRKVNREEDLIKFVSENNISEGKKLAFTFRIKAYSTVLVVLIGILVTLIITRSMFDATVLRVPGQILQDNNDGTISNLYHIKIVSKSSVVEPYSLSLDDQTATLERVGKKLDSLKFGEETEETFFIRKSKSNISERKEKLVLQIRSGDKIVQTKKITFIGKY
jgi:cytochrome c oxidase accessory protein FixG